MIQFNLLPDVKLEYIKAQRTRQLMTGVSLIITVASIALLGILFAIGGLQKKHIKDLSKDIARESSQLKSEPNIDKILTVQNQLESLTSIHSAKPAASNTFTYLNDVTPNNVSINNFEIDFTEKKITITGGANSLGDVNKFVDTLKYTKYQEEGANTSDLAFKDVVLDSFSLNTNALKGDKAATYSIKLAYQDIIFDITKKIKLNVPKLVTTRAGLDQPTELFEKSSNAGGQN